MTQDDGMDTTDPQITLAVTEVPFCDCPDCKAIRAAGDLVIEAWAKTDYSPGLMTDALQKLKEALAKPSAG